MFLKHQKTQDLIEVLTLDELYNPCQSKITGRSHAGEEMQDPETFPKAELLFPSGECLPRCWVDAHYQESRLRPVETLTVV